MTLKEDPKDLFNNVDVETGDLQALLADRASNDARNLKFHREERGNVEFVRDSMVTSFKNSVDFLLTSDFGQEDTN